MKLMFKNILKKSLFLVLCSLIYLGIGYVLAILISSRHNYNMQDVMFYEGLLLFILGLLASMKGNPSGTSLWGLGQQNAQYMSYYNLEITRKERESTDYYKNFFKHSVVEFAFNNLAFILGGIFIMAFSNILLK